MRIAIFGSGSIGGYFGGRLSRAGEDVVFVARGEHLNAMLTQGLRVDSINGDFVLPPVQATDNPSKIGKVDMVLVGVKAWQVPEAAEAIRPMIGPETFVLPLQNGLEAPAQLCEILGEQHVLGGLCGLFCYMAGPGHIIHAGTASIFQLYSNCIIIMRRKYENNVLNHSTVIYFCSDVCPFGRHHEGLSPSREGNGSICPAASTTG
jgi:2-dehydropantoate 2-reductase